VTGGRVGAARAAVAGAVAALLVGACAAPPPTSTWSPGPGPAWSAPAAGAGAPAAIVVASAAAWRSACDRLRLPAHVAPAAWLVFAAGRGFALVVPAGRALCADPVATDEEGVEVLAFTVVAAPTSAPMLHAWTLPADGRRWTIVYRDGAAPMTPEQVVWIDPP
jgi:hypothetical protein